MLNGKPWHDCHGFHANNSYVQSVEGKAMCFENERRVQVTGRFHKHSLFFDGSPVNGATAFNKSSNLNGFSKQGLERLFRKLRVSSEKTPPVIKTNLFSNPGYVLATIL